MKIRATICALALPLAGCSSFRHVPPGQSLDLTYARKAEFVEAPPAPPRPVAVRAPLPPGAISGMPETENVADAYTLGNLCMQQGRYAAAIDAYQTALKADPTFGDAWNSLAIAYQRLGQQDKAMEAFKRYKMLAVH